MKLGISVRRLLCTEMIEKHQGNIAPEARVSFSSYRLEETGPQIKLSCFESSKIE